MNLSAVAAQAALYWLLFPAVAVPVCLLAARRGHRGFFERLAPWFAIIPITLGASYLGHGAFAGLLIACGVAACWELARLGNARPPDRPAASGRLGVDPARFSAALACAIPWIVWAEMARGFPVALAVVAVLAPVIVFFLLPAAASLRWSAPLLGVSLGAALSFWVLLQRLPGGFRWVLVAFSVVVLNDVMAFATGRLVPGPRPFPTLSPGKTVTGYAGGLVCGTLAAFILSFAVPEFDAVTLLGGGVLVASCGSLGDLLASAVKRRHGAKDFGNVLGAQGGMLDRLDSMLGAGMAFYLFVLITVGSH